MKRLLLLILVLFAAFAIVSCGSETETAVEEAQVETEVVGSDDVQVTQCDGNVCTHEAGSSRECATDGVCPGKDQAEMAAAGVGGCPRHAECAKAGRCASGGTCACKGACDGQCGDDCDGKCGHVCTEEACGDDCPHAKAAAGTHDHGSCAKTKTARSGS